ncbi:uncharacterized protein LOC123318845 [Coccinella septempunctata]|uniref:uncharacterized protein LOC123318845 n=1 Tax=Coccinella septempunctata TaxID=41139 RepID=UPI001D05EECE|nr:uncharacterized protein LOC123318845 [Coccinella septempunctata]
MNDNVGGFYQSIRNEYGGDIVELLKMWSNTNKKLSAVRNRIVFLLKCRQKQISPSHIANNFKFLHTLKADRNPFFRDIDKLISRFQKSVLNVEIDITIWKIKKLEYDYNTIRNKLVTSIPPQLFNAISDRSKEDYNKLFKLIRERNLKKLGDLCRETATFKRGMHDNFIFNYTNVILPEPIKDTLCAGPKFAIPISPRECPIPTLIKDIEFCIGDQVELTEVDKNVLRGITTNILTNYLARSANEGPCMKQTYLNYVLTSRFLKQHPDCIVMRADKGNSTVIMYRDEYIPYMENLLSDTGTYKITPSDPTNKFQTLANEIVKELRDVGAIDEMKAKHLKCRNSVIPKLYGLRKTHKENISIRPVVSCIGAPSYNLSKYIHDILSPVTTSFEYNISNSKDFVDFVKEIRVPKESEWVSLDVVSLYTNIPKPLVLHIIKKRWQYISAYTTIPQNLFCKIVEYIFDSSYFSFNGVIYVQIDGAAMGNPASGTLAALVMDEVITIGLRTLTFDVHFIKLYVDDTIFSVPKGKSDELLLKFNNVHHKLQFTIERESEATIPFLDILLIRNEDGTISTNWYTKPTSSGRMLNYRSQHPTSQKIATITNLMFRAIHLSDERFHRENELKITELLTKNNYPTTLVKRVLNQYKRKVLTDNAGSRGDERTRYYRFPYIQGLSENMSRALQQTNPSIIQDWLSIR